jgi:hypothetical protein
MSYLVKRNIIHNDLKRENILLYPEDNDGRPTGYYSAIIGDFGKSLNKDVDKDAYRIFNNGVVRLICILNKLVFLITRWLPEFYNF